MEALSFANVIAVECGEPFKEGFGARSIVTVIAQIDEKSSIDYVDGLPDAAQVLAEEHAPQDVATARRELAEMPANWYSMHFELQLV